MDVLGDRKFVEIPGGKTHELPPLLVRTAPRQVKRMDRVVDLANNLVESEELVDAFTENHAQRRMDLAVNLADQYIGLITHWQWGDSIIEWIRQCEITFETRLELRNLLHANVWPHAGRSSFVTLLADKHVKTDGITLEKAVGLRLTFRQPPPISCFSDQFLFYLNSSVAATAYQTWAHLGADPAPSFPPERFRFDVVNMALAPN